MLGALDGPIITANTITPSNTTTFVITRALYIGNSGNVSVTMGIPNGDGICANVVFVNVPTGVILPIRAKKVLTDTTANNILGLY